ncbi:unnamed protein product [Lathyrus sativus]|nr:unnamed protein product [Lathyrus sativus]
MATTTTSFLSPTQRYAAAALFGLSLHESQVNQTRILPLPASDDSISNTYRISSSSFSSIDSVSNDPDLWVHHHSGLLQPVFKFLDIDSSAWYGLEETAGSSSATHHVGPYMRLLSQEFDEGSAESSQRLD